MNTTVPATWSVAAGWRKVAVLTVLLITLIAAPHPASAQATHVYSNQDPEYQYWVRYVQPQYEAWRNAARQAADERRSRETSWPSYSSPAENGSYYGEISRITGLPKTVYVRGYTRTDGTYVRAYWRSHQ